MSNPSDKIASGYHARCVWLYEKVVGERDVITHVRCSLRMDETPLLEAVAELPAPDPQAFDEYWQDADHPLWEQMQDPPGFEQPKHVQRDKLAPWAWSVLDRDALEAEGLAKWRAILAARQTEPAPDLAAELRALRERLDAMTAREPAPEPAPIEPETHFADLMLADETLDDARARLSQRLRELRHYLMAPEIRVNEDGSLGLTGEEQSELQDLERRQTLGRWLEA